MSISDSLRTEEEAAAMMLCWDADDSPACVRCEWRRGRQTREGDEPPRAMHPTTSRVRNAGVMAWEP